MQDKNILPFAFKEYVQAPINGITSAIPIDKNSEPI